MEKKIKLKRSRDNAFVSTTIHLNQDVYKRLCDMAYSTKIPKKVFINEGIKKMLDDIELYGLDVE